MKPLQPMIALFCGLALSIAGAAPPEEDFLNPPDSARPGVYWYFMDGNLSRQGMTDDLESMKEVGLGNLVFLEVNVGVPRGPVDFMSDRWQELFAHAVHEAERLGIDITLGAGPGWTGSGGPWVKPEQSMQHLVFSVVETQGPEPFDAVLPVPAQRSTPWHNMRSPFYEDVAVYAFPRREPIIDDVDEKALYARNPYTSMPGVKPWLPAPALFQEPPSEAVVSSEDIVDLTDRLDSEGRLRWDVPGGEWTIVRMGRRSTGASTRPAPAPGVGFDHDKLDAAALDDHFENYYGKLLKKVGPRTGKHGWTTVHLDSWEMGAQNWTPKFREEFKTRRGYDPMPFLLAYTGRAVESVEKSERFLWDVRLTAQELVLENYAGHLKQLGHRHGFELSIEPYDMNPTADLDLGAVADVPMCEFWSAGMGFDSSFSCIEATSIAHTMGRPIVSSEAFTATHAEGWRQFPCSMKNQGDWAFAMGINRFVYHTFAHQPLGDQHRPGMTMGPYGVHWDRGQTWWPMVKDYHRYVARCSHLLRQGVAVADILYVTPEGAPHVFRPPPSALEGNGPLADKKGYGFDGCSPNILLDRAEVQAGRIAFPGGTSYRLMVLPQCETMTPELLAKIETLVEAGATVVGSPPVKSPSLSNYPECDAEVRSLAAKLWGTLQTPETITRRRYGRGTIYWGGEFSSAAPAKAPVLEASHWIWYPEASPAHNAPAGTRYFKRTLHLDGSKTLRRARALVTADNEFTLWINGRKVDRGDNFHVTTQKDILPFLRPGVNVLAIAAVNLDIGANPAGLIAAFELNYNDGSRQVIHTDKAWRTGLKDSPGWEKTPDVPADWKAAVVLGGYSMAPWGRSSADAAPALFPHYDDTAALLRKLGVGEDFAATGTVRYGHRRTEDRDIYFVSNRSNAPIRADCAFRVGSGQPELWHPVSGARRFLPQYRSDGGLTTVPMAFAPHESFFIVFARNGSSKDDKAVAHRVNFPKTRPVATLEGSWKVSFDPRWGGPEEVAFDTLEDWTERIERGIKFYSGIATYRKRFDYAAEPAADAAVYLDLGTVHDVARVRLNGEDLGVVWCDPWRVDVSHALKAGENHLEIEVANRWPNRLIGDRQAPDAGVRTVRWPSGLLGGREYKTGRYTFSTSGGYNKLLPSGLLGPVALRKQWLQTPKP